MPLLTDEGGGRQKKTKAPIDVETFLNPPRTSSDRLAAYNMLAEQQAVAASGPRFSGSLVGGVPAGEARPTLAEARARIMAVNNTVNPTTMAPAMAAKSGAGYQLWKAEPEEGVSWQTYEYDEDGPSRPDEMPRILNGAALNAERTAAYAALDEALRAQREEAIADPKEGKPIRKRVDRLTLEEWEAMDPQQRAAIEFNAELVGAVRKDRRLEKEYDTDKEERAEYDKAVAAMFGEDGGSEKFAPETVALLSQLGYEDQSADLDDFLGLKMAVKAKDLDNLTLPATPSAVMGESVSPIPDKQYERVSAVRSLIQGNTGDGEVDGFRDIKQQLVKDRMRLEGLGPSLGLERQDHVGFLGGQPDRDPVGQGLIEDVDSYFEQAMAYLNDTTGTYDPRTVWDTVRAELSPTQYRQFVNYAENHKAKGGSDGKAS